MPSEKNPSEAAFVLTHVAWALGRVIVLQNRVVKTTAWNAVWDTEVEKLGQKLLNSNHVPFIKSIVINQRGFVAGCEECEELWRHWEYHDVNEVSSTSIEF